jgi:hypothetical protein
MCTFLDKALGLNIDRMAVHLAMLDRKNET